MPSRRQRRYERLRRLVESGQLQIGPRMVLPDMFLTDPELVIDNLLLGERMGRELGVPQAAGIDWSDIFGSILVGGRGWQHRARGRPVGRAPR